MYGEDTERIVILRKRVWEFYEQMDAQARRTCFGHWLDHVGRVVNNAHLVVKQDDIESPELVIAAALLHDIAYLDGKGAHVQKSAEQAPSFLANLFEINDIQTVQRFILSHSRDLRDPETSGEKAIYVADKLDMLGVDGSVRMIIEQADGVSTRDQLAESVLRLTDQYAQYCLSLNVAQALVEARWNESRELLGTILERSPTSI